MGYLLGRHPAHAVPEGKAANALMSASKGKKMPAMSSVDKNVAAQIALKKRKKKKPLEGGF